jgi:mRNA export factor
MVTESPLKFPTSSITAFAKGNGYLVGSIEGRCGVKNFDCNS